MSDTKLEVMKSLAGSNRPAIEVLYLMAAIDYFTTEPIRRAPGNKYFRQLERKIKTLRDQKSAPTLRKKRNG